MQKIILVPFSLKSVLLYEKINMVATAPIFFFDQNLKLNKRKYKNTFIVKPFHVEGAKIIISSKYYEVDIKKRYYEMGYKEEDFISEEDLGIDLCDDFKAASQVDVDLFSQLHVDFQGQKKMELKKLRKMYDISASDYLETSEIFGIDEYGHGRKEVIIDKQGTAHIFLKRLELDVTSRCTLKCKYCSNMMQYYQNPCDIDEEIILDDYSRMLDLVDWIDEVLIIGGEPFIYKKLDSLIKKIKTKKQTHNKVGTIQIVTNGTIVPDDSVLKTLSEYEVFVFISNYGNKSRNLVKLVNKLCEYNIDYDVMDLLYWADVEQYVDAREIMSDEKRLNWRKEMCSTLHRVIDQGRFYLCCHLKSLDQLDAISAEAKDCYVNIYDSDAKERLVMYLSENEPLPKACSWCNGNSFEQWKKAKIKAAEQTKEILKYTKY